MSSSKTLTMTGSSSALSEIFLARLSSTEINSFSATPKTSQEQTSLYSSQATALRKPAPTSPSNSSEETHRHSQKNNSNNNHESSDSQKNNSNNNQHSHN